jgi:hypothetical protein
VRIAAVSGGATVVNPVSGVALRGPAPAAGYRVGKLVSAPGAAVHDHRQWPDAADAVPIECR